MVQARLISVAAFLLVAISLAPMRSVPVENDESLPDERSEWERFSQRCSSDSLKTMTQAEADFRANHPEEGPEEDFWDIDVSGLYTTVPDVARKDTDEESPD